jgi:hypothetical protein
VLVYEKIVQDVDRASAGGEYLLYQLYGVPLDHDFARRICNFDFILQNVQSSVHYIERGPSDMYIGFKLTMEGTQKVRHTRRLGIPYLV